MISVGTVSSGLNRACSHCSTTGRPPVAPARATAWPLLPWHALLAFGPGPHKTRESEGQHAEQEAAVSTQPFP